MESSHPFPDSARLTSVVHGVRDRWRLKRALRGASIVLGVAFVLLVGSAYLLARLHYEHAALLTARVIVFAIVAVLAVVLVAAPYLPRRKPSDRRVALYLEEHAPSLDAAVLTAVELQELETARARNDEATRARRAVSTTLLSHLTTTALERVHTIDDGRHVDERELHVSAAILAGIAGMALLVTFLAPTTLRQGMSMLLGPSSASTGAANVYAISAEPGNITVARGGDLLIAARLRGFQSDEVDLLVRQRDSTTWQRLTMALDSVGKFAGRYTFRLFDIAVPMEYVVESNGVRSPAYRIDVADVPYTKKLGLEYRFPVYTGMAPQAVDEGGDIAALKGTQVRVRIATTVPARGGRLIVERGEHNDTIPLTPNADGTLGGSLRVDAAGFYKVELTAQDGRIFPGSLDYTIDALPDRPPTIIFTKPGRDEKVLNVDEVYAEAQADDDYGVSKMELVYSVNGSPEKTEPLYSAAHRTPQMTAGHTFSLEDFKLQPGDVVSYYARATDNDAVSGAKTASTDIYFLTVRPFAQDYKQDQGAGGGGGGGNDDAGQLSEQERQIIAGTFNTLRDKASKQQKELQEDLSTLRVSQQKLRSQTEELARRIVDRGIAARDSNFGKIAEILKKAAPVMDTAEKALADGNGQTALGPEQRALQQLQRAEAVFRNVRISMGGEGGGGGGGQQRAQDLADLFELNREKLRNQYESVQRGREQQQQADQQIDETAEKLKQLASRLQQENERAQRKSDSLSQRMGASGSSGGASQRQMAQQAEDAARQLERLAREKAQQQRQEGNGSQSNSSSSSSASSSSRSQQQQQQSSAGTQSQQREQRALEEAARRLRDAADAMRRAASGNNGQQSAAEAAAAQQRIEEARKLLDQQRTGRLERDVQDVLESAKQLAKQEQQVAGDVGKLWDNANGQERGQQLQSLTDKKGQMANDLRDLKARMDKLSLDSRRENKDAANGLAEASKTMRDHKTEEKIRASQGAMRYAGPEYTKGLESAIGNDLNDLQQRLEQVATAARNGSGKQSDQASQSQALDKTRDLVRGMQSLDERMRNAQGQSGKGPQGNGQQSQQAQNGQQGQQSGQQNGQQGQNGQRSQSGQQGQGAQQGQRGQQGQNGQQGQSGQGQQGGQSQANQPGGGGSGQSGMRAGQNGGGRVGSEVAGGPPGGQSLGQFGREMRERLSDAQALRNELQRQKLDTRDLDKAIAGMQSLSNDRILADERSAADLRAQTLEHLKAFEFTLRKSLGESDETRVLLGRSGDVPAAFKQYVEEYYRSLAKKP